MPRGKAFSPLVLLSHQATLHSGLLTIMKIDTFNGEYKISIYACPYSSLQSIYSFNQNANYITVLYAAHVQSLCRQFTFPPPPSSCLAALFPYQEAVRLESNFNRIRFTVTASVILMIINPSTIVIHYSSAISNQEQITCCFSVNSEVI